MVNWLKWKHQSVNWDELEWNQIWVHPFLQQQCICYRFFEIFSLAVVYSFLSIHTIYYPNFVIKYIFNCQGGTPIAQQVKSSPAMQETGGHKFELWVGKLPSRRKWQPTPVFLPGEYHWQRSLVDYSPWGRKRMVHDWACICLEGNRIRVPNLVKAWSTLNKLHISVHNEGLQRASVLLIVRFDETLNSLRIVTSIIIIPCFSPYSLFQKHQ